MVTWGSHFNPRYLFTFADVHHVVAGYRTAPPVGFRQMRPAGENGPLILCLDTSGSMGRKGESCAMVV
jgi:hypothetical protein